MKKCAILGFGNPVRGDDAIGCEVVNYIKNELITYKDTVSVFDMGTNGFEVLFALPGHSKIIVVDAVLESGSELGNIYKVPADELLKAPEDDPMLFLHGMKWNQGLSYAKKIMGNQYPNDINAYLISIENTSMVEAMNEKVRKAGDIVAQKIIEEVMQWLN